MKKSIFRKNRPIGVRKRLIFVLFSHRASRFVPNGTICEHGSKYSLPSVSSDSTQLPILLDFSLNFGFILYIFGHKSDTFQLPAVHLLSESKYFLHSASEYVHFSQSSCVVHYAQFCVLFFYALAFCTKTGKIPSFLPIRNI